MQFRKIKKLRGQNNTLNRFGPVMGPPFWGKKVPKNGTFLNDFQKKRSKLTHKGGTPCRLFFFRQASGVGSHKKKVAAPSWGYFENLIRVSTGQSFAKKSCLTGVGFAKNGFESARWRARFDTGDKGSARFCAFFDQKSASRWLKRLFGKNLSWLTQFFWASTGRLTRKISGFRHLTAVFFIKKILSKGTPASTGWLAEGLAWGRPNRRFFESPTQKVAFFGRFLSNRTDPHHGAK